MASMFIKRRKQDTLHFKILNAKRAKIEGESASQDSMSNEEEAEDTNWQDEAFDLPPPLDSNTTQTSTDVPPNSPDSPEPDQRSNSLDFIEPRYTPEPDQRSNSLDFIEPRYTPAPEPDQRSNSLDFIEPRYSDQRRRSNSPNSIEPRYSPDPHQPCSSPDPTEPIYNSVPSPPGPEREINSEQEDEELFPSQQNRRVYSVNELEQSAENLPLQRVQELQALGNILFLVGRSMSGIASLYDLLLKPGVDFQRDADTRSIFNRRVRLIALNMDSAINIMHGIDFSNCFEKNNE